MDLDPNQEYYPFQSRAQRINVVKVPDRRRKPLVSRGGKVTVTLVSTAGQLMQSYVLNFLPNS